MKWIINFIKKVLRLLTGKQQTIQNDSSQNLLAKQNQVNKATIEKHEVSEVLETSPPLINQANTKKPISNEPKVKTEKEIKTSEVLIGNINENKSSNTEKKVDDSSDNYMGTEGDSDDYQPGHRSANQRIHVSGQPYKKSLTGPINENLIKIQRQVNYPPNIIYTQKVPEYFPLVLMPVEQTIIKPPVNGKTCKKGMTEESFCRDFLIKYFKDQIYDSLTVFIGSTPHEPDLAFIDLESGKNIFIDIEIDEPYDGVTRQPTHYLTSSGIIDDDRNKGFTDRGWMVIRLAEEQVVENPHGCCKYIGEVIKSVFVEFYSDCLSYPKSIDKVRIWTKEEAILLAKENKREKYLGIDSFFESDEPRNYLISDSELGKEIENNISNSKVIRTNERVQTSPSGANQSSSSYEPPYSSKHPASIITTTIVTENVTRKVPPPIIEKKPEPEEPRVTKKTENPSQPAPQPYAYD